MKNIVLCELMLHLIL